MPAQPSKRRVLPWNGPQKSAPGPTPTRVVKKTRSDIKKAKATQSKKVTPPQARLEDSRRRHEAALALISLSRLFSAGQAAVALVQLSQSDDTMEAAPGLSRLARSEDKSEAANAFVMLAQSEDEDVMDAASALIEMSTADVDTH
jgi:hypothetical protein